MTPAVSGLAVFALDALEGADVPSKHYFVRFAVAAALAVAMLLH